MPGCPIQTSPDQWVFGPSPKLIAAFHVFLLHLTPRHPPSALSSLATIFSTNKFKRFDANILADKICKLLRCFSKFLKQHRLLRLI